MKEAVIVDFHLTGSKKVDVIFTGVGECIQGRRGNGKANRERAWQYDPYVIAHMFVCFRAHIIKFHPQSLYALSIRKMGIAIWK